MSLKTYTFEDGRTAVAVALNPARRIIGDMGAVAVRCTENGRDLWPEGYRAEPLGARPMAAPGLTSYRYRGQFGFVMIGARDDADALREAARSIEGAADPSRLEMWDAETGAYHPLTKEA